MAPRSRVFRLFTPGRLLSLGALLAVGFFALAVLSSNDYIFLPDKAHPVATLVRVQGGHEPRNGGGIYFVDVIVRKATLLEYLLGGLHEGADLYPASVVVPPGETSAQQDKLDLQEMKTSQRTAAAVALRALGKKVVARDTGALVSQVGKGFPAAGELFPTDVIVAIDRTAVRSPADVAHVMGAKAVGSILTFTVLRQGKRIDVPLKTVAAGSDSTRGIVGIIVSPNTVIQLPLKVSIDAHGVGGPSAGLAFALDVMQQLGRDVDRGYKVAATGEIFLNGDVGPIGGIKQKTIGAREAGVDVFLVPVANVAGARKVAHGLRIIPVKSFQQALHALQTLPRKG